EPLTRLRVNEAGLWLLDGGASLYLNPRRGAALAGWAAKAVATQVKDVFFGPADAAVLRQDGGVVTVADATPQGVRVLVGDRAAGDVQGKTQAVAEFDGDLYVAAGEHLGRYDLRTHAWKEVPPAGNTPVERLVT